MLVAIAARWRTHWLHAPLAYDVTRLRILGVARIAFALLTLAAAATQLVSQVDNDRSVANFFSFFTVESNLIAAVVLLVTGAGAIRGHSGERWGWWRGAATTYMVTTGITYFVLLRGLEDSLNTTIPWVNSVLHYVIPVVMLADWLVDPPRPGVSTRTAMWWLAFPLAYAVYSLLRGPVVDWYPYPFIDPREHGYPAIAATSVVLALVIGLIAFSVAAYSRRLRRPALV